MPLKIVNKEMRLKKLIIYRTLRLKKRNAKYVAKNK